MTTPDIERLEQHLAANPWLRQAIEKYPKTPPRRTIDGVDEMGARGISPTSY